MDLRVHTTAPSTKKDDERFIAQAEAYACFVATRTLTSTPDDGLLAAVRHPTSMRQPEIVPTNMIPESQKTPVKSTGDLTGFAYDPTTFLEETQLGYTALESQLFAPKSRNPAKASKHSIRPLEESLIFAPSSQVSTKVPGQSIRHVEKSQLLAPSSRISTKFPRHSITPLEDSTTEVSKPEDGPSQLIETRHDGSSSSHQVPSQSSYLKSPDLTRSKKKARINDENLRFFPTRNSILPSIIPSREDSNHAVESVSNAYVHREASLPSQRHIASLVDGSVSNDDVTSELPTSYSLSDMTSVSSKGRQHSTQRSVSDPGPPPLEATESVLARPEAVTERSLESPSRDVTRIPDHAAPAISPYCPASPKPSNSDTVVKDFANVQDSRNSIDDGDAKQQKYSGLPTSIRPPAPQPSLQPFKSHITESLRYLGENTNLKKCYKPVFVSRDLRQSERGCWTFDITPWPAQLRLEFFQFLAKMIEPGRVGWGVWCTRELASLEVRMYCWGEVASHVYLMLYVASKSKVRKLGLTWVDAEGDVIVQMRGADAWCQERTT
jgi:hypothetical protein